MPQPPCLVTILTPHFGATGNAMPYNPRKPGWLHYLLVTLRAVYYTMAGLAGFGAFFFTPVSFEGTVSYNVTMAGGIIVVVVSLFGLIGVVTEECRIELGALPFVMGGLACYALTLWYLLGETVSRLAQAGAITALTIITFIRLVDLLIVHRKLNQQNRMA